MEDVNLADELQLWKSRAEELIFECNRLDTRQLDLLRTENEILKLKMRRMIKEKDEYHSKLMENLSKDDLLTQVNNYVSSLEAEMTTLEERLAREGKLALEYKSEISKLMNSQKEELKEKGKDLREKTEELQHAREEIEQIRNEKDHLEKKMQEFSDLQENESKKETERLTNDISHYVALAENLQLDLEQVKGECNCLKISNKELTSKLQNTSFDRIELENAQQDSEQYKSELTNLQNGYKSIESELEKSKSELEVLQDKLKKSELETNDLSIKLKESISVNDKAHMDQKDAEKLQKQLHEMSEKNKKLKEKMKTAKTYVIDLVKTQSEKMKTLKEDHQNEIKNLEKAANDTKQSQAENTQKLEEEMTKVKAEHQLMTKGLNQKVQDYEDKRKALQEELDVMKDALKEQKLAKEKLSEDYEKERKNRMSEHDKMTKCQIELRKQIMDKEKDVQTLKKKVADITDEKRQLLNEKANTQKELELSKILVDKLENQVQKYQEEVQSCQTQVRSILKELEDARQVDGGILALKEAKIKLLTEKLLASEAEKCSKVKKVQTSLEKQLNEKRAQISSMSKIQQEREKAYDKSIAEYKDKIMMQVKKNAEQKEYIHKCQKLSAKLEQAAKDRITLQKYHEDFASLKLEYGSLKEEIKAIKEENKDLKLEHASYLNLLESAEVLRAGKSQPQNRKRFFQELEEANKSFKMLKTAMGYDNKDGTSPAELQEQILKMNNEHKMYKESSEKYRHCYTTVVTKLNKYKTIVTLLENQIKTFKSKEAQHRKTARELHEQVRLLSENVKHDKAMINLYQNQQSTLCSAITDMCEKRKLTEPDFESNAAKSSTVQPPTKKPKIIAEVKPTQKTLQSEDQNHISQNSLASGLVTPPVTPVTTSPSQSERRPSITGHTNMGKCIIAAPVQRKRISCTLCSKGPCLCKTTIETKDVNEIPEEVKTIPLPTSKPANNNNNNNNNNSNSNMQREDSDVDSDRDPYEEIQDLLHDATEELFSSPSSEQCAGNLPNDASNSLSSTKTPLLPDPANHPYTTLLTVPTSPSKKTLLLKAITSPKRALLPTPASPPKRTLVSQTSKSNNLHDTRNRQTKMKLHKAIPHDRKIVQCSVCKLNGSKQKKCYVEVDPQRPVEEMLQHYQVRHSVGHADFLQMLTTHDLVRNAACHMIDITCTSCANKFQNMKHLMKHLHTRSDHFLEKMSFLRMAAEWDVGLSDREELLQKLIGRYR